MSKMFEAIRSIHGTEEGEVVFSKILDESVCKLRYTEDKIRLSLELLNNGGANDASVVFTYSEDTGLNYSDHVYGADIDKLDFVMFCMEHLMKKILADNKVIRESDDSEKVENARTKIVKRIFLLMAILQLAVHELDGITARDEYNEEPYGVVAEGKYNGFNPYKTVVKEKNIFIKALRDTYASVQDNNILGEGKKVTDILGKVEDTWDKLGEMGAALERLRGKFVTSGTVGVKVNSF